MRIAMLVANDMTADARVDREAAALAGAGHEVAVFCLGHPGQPAAEERAGYSVERVAEFATAGAWRPFAKIAQARARDAQLAAAAGGWRPDAVHCHDTNTLVAGARVARSLGALYVYDAHELYPDSLAQHRIQGTWPVQAHWRRIERRLVPGSSAVITVCAGLAGELEERFGVRPAVVANAVPLADPEGKRGLLREELGIPSELAIALYQGALNAGRALDELVDAVEAAPGIALVVQGTGSREGAMRERVVARGLRHRVWFMGQVPHERLFEYTCGADIGTCFLDGITLNHRLAWPNRLFVYMMAGIPAVVTDLPGMRALVVEPGAALAVSPGDVGAMAGALSRLASDPDGRARMGARARELAESRYNWERESRTLIAVYERLAEERAR